MATLTLGYSAAALALAPAAYAAGRSAVDFVLSGYMVAYLQTDFMRLGCF